MRIRSVALAVAAASLSLALAACSGGSSSPSTSATSAAPTTSAAPAVPAWVVNDCQTGQPTPTDTDPGLPVVAGAEGIAVSDGAGAPVVAVSASSAPATGLVAVDLIEGTGDPVPATGATVTVEYCGVGQQTRTLFDASWVRGETATFPLDGVIAGWTEGIPGMKPGGRRVLVIPSDLAYGPDGRPPVILPNETLIFVVELIDWSA